MEKLWAPWRSKYIHAEKPIGCIFCRKPKQKKDKINFIVARRKHGFAILNIFPYNNGHVLVAPFRHINALDKLSFDEQADLMQLTVEIINILKKKLKPQGFNVGINLGKVAGAGIINHIHIHIVPRWAADTNFFPVIAKTKVISQSLDELYIVS
ncbi:MAG: HIT domain-containing protein [Candidatus Omnitrophica bacterium]|nr:HIT domain-containing protein [Candidatus Omnitrophota bacterium]